MSDNPDMDDNETLWLQHSARADFAAEVTPPPAWLQKARILGQWQVSAESLGTALEAALCELAGLPRRDGLFPWAEWGAVQAGWVGSHWAELHLVHWHVSQGQVLALHPHWPQADALDLLWSELTEFIASAGLTLIRQTPDRAWVHGAVLQDLPTASLDKVLGRPVAGFLPDSGALLRLQSELQMWLYHHPALQHSATPVNSVWFSGTGALSPALVPVLQRLRPLADPTPPDHSLCLSASAEQASLWRANGASFWQRLGRRWRVQTGAE